MLVDDDPKIRSMLTKYFEAEGFRVSAAENGVQLRQNALNAIDLILLDIGLPGEDGLTLARDIRTVSQTARLGDVIVGTNLEADDAVDVIRPARNDNDVSKAYHQNGALLVPSFAVERTQELLADFNALMDAGELLRCPIIIDSPLASRATEIFKRHARSLSNGNLLMNALRSRTVRFTESAEQSKAVDLISGFHIVIAASGMCEAGRIRHRLKNWLWRDEGTVLLVGFQAQGTLGRILQDGARTVKIQGEEIVVRAAIRSIEAHSGHADATELVDWVAARKPIRSGLFLVHGEPVAIDGLKDRLSAAIPAATMITPSLDSGYRLTKTGAVEVLRAAPPPRLSAEQVGHRDWHNDYQSVVLDLEEKLRQAADQKGRAVILRKVRRALQEEAS